MIERARLGRALTAAAAQPPVPMKPWLDDARIEGIDALLAARWRSSPNLAETDRSACDDVLNRATARELLFHTQERSVLAALHVAGIDALVLKGAALSRWLYAEPRLRPRSDLDVLLRSEADFGRCRDALAVLGYADRDLPVLSPSYERALRKPIGSGEHSVDVHWRLSNHPAFAQCFEFDRLWRTRQSLHDLPYGFGLAPLHAMIHACLHRASNLTAAAGDKLIWLYDIALLASRFDAADWQALVDQATTAQVAEPCRHSFVAVAAHFGTTIPDKVMQTLSIASAREAFRMDRAHRLGYRSWWALRTRPWPERPLWLWRRAFPNWHYMQVRFGLVHRWELPWAWVTRIVRLIASFWR